MSQQNTPENEGKNKPEDKNVITLTQAELDAKLNKIRSDVKDKVYGDVEAARKKAEEAENKLKEHESVVLSMKERLEKIEAERQELVKKQEDERKAAEEAAKTPDQKTKEMFDTTLEVKQRVEFLNAQVERSLEDQAKKFAEELAKVREAAISEVTSYKLQVYKDSTIAQSGLLPQFAKMVTGGSQEEIAESIKTLKGEQDSFYSEVEAAVAKKYEGMPKPLGTGTTPTLIQQEEKRTLLKMSDSEYEAMIQTKLAEAKARK
jgi:hypothetical protein